MSTVTEPAAPNAAVAPTAEAPVPAAEPTAPALEPATQPTEQEGAAPVAETTEPTDRPDRRSSRQSAIDDAKKVFEANQVQEGEEPAAPDLKTSVGKDGKERVHRADGSFASKDEAEGVAPEGAAPAGEEAGEPERTADVPEGFVKIELPEDHPWRRGEAFSELVVPQGQQEQLIRAAVNQPVLRREVETLHDKVEELTRRNRELQIRSDLEREGTLPNQDPRMAALLEQIKGHPDYADLHDRLQRAVEIAPEAAVAEKMREAESQDALISTAEEFLGKVDHNAARLFPVWNETGQLKQHLARELAMYGDYVDSIQGKQPDVNEFFHRLNSRYSQDPQVLESLRGQLATKAEATREKMREEIRAELEAERVAADQAAGQQAQARHKTVRGVGDLGRAGSGGQRALEPETSTERIQKMPPSTRRSALRKEVVELGRAHS